MLNIISKYSYRIVYIIGMIGIFIVMYLYDNAIEEYHQCDYIFFVVCAILMTLLFIGRGIQSGIKKSAMVIFSMNIWLTTLQPEYINALTVLLVRFNFFSLKSFIEYQSILVFPIILGLFLLMFMVIPKGYFCAYKPTGFGKLLFQEKKVD